MSRAPLAARLGLAAFLCVAAAFFLLPLYVMVVTSLKPLDELRAGALFAWPLAPTLAPWRAAWSEACTGVACAGVRAGFVNSLAIAVPSTLHPLTLVVLLPIVKHMTLGAAGRPTLASGDHSGFVAAIEQIKGARRNIDKRAIHTIG